MPFKKRHHTHTDRDLAGIKARRDSAPMDAAYPIEIDPELTPTPATPPTAEQLERMDVADQIRVLLENENKNAAAIVHEQNERREAKELGALEATVRGLVGSSREWSHASSVVEQTLLPAVRAMGDDLKLLLQSRDFDKAQQTEMVKAFERLNITVGKLDERARQLEVRIEKFVTIMEGLAARDHELSVRLERAESRIAKLGEHHAVSVALTRREKAKIGGVASAVTTVIAWAIHHFIAS